MSILSETVAGANLGISGFGTSFDTCIEQSIWSRCNGGMGGLAASDLRCTSYSAGIVKDDKMERYGEGGSHQILLAGT